MKKQNWKRNKDFRQGVKNARKAKKLKNKAYRYTIWPPWYTIFFTDEEKELFRLRRDMYDEAETLENKAKEQLQRAWEDIYEYLKFFYHKDIERLRELKEKRKPLLKEEKYHIRCECEKLGHIYVTTSENELVPTGQFTYLGQMYQSEDTRECIVCGSRMYVATTKVPLWCKGKNVIELPEKHKKMLKEVHARYTEKIEAEITALEQKLEPLSEFCQLFGHDAYKINDAPETYECRCCTKVMSREELRADNIKAEFKTMVHKE